MKIGGLPTRRDLFALFLSGRSFTYLARLFAVSRDWVEAQVRREIRRRRQ